MPAVFRHFAINADDVPRAKSFYQQAFGWDFTPWGPPGFYQIKNAGDGLLGVEASFGVADIKATLAAVTAAGGKIIMPPYRIEGVGELMYFEDTEGNFLGAMQYEPGFFD